MVFVILSGSSNVSFHQTAELPRHKARDRTGAPLGHVAKGGQDQLHTDVGHDEGHAVPRSWARWFVEGSNIRNKANRW